MPPAEQLIIDLLVPPGREKFGVRELCRLLAVDGEPLSPRTVRDALVCGQLGGNRLPLSAAPGSEERIKIEWATADDLRLYLARTRTLSPAEHKRRCLDLFERWGPSDLDDAIRHLTALRARAARRA